jgi:aminomethyltransferase
MSLLRESLAVRPSPFYDRAAEHCLTNAWTREGALTLVEVYSALEEEYWALAVDAGLMDLSARHAYRVKGTEADAALEHMLATRIADMAPGQLREVIWCIDSGYVAGQGVVLREGADAFVLVTEEPAGSWIADSLAGFSCGLADMSQGMGRLGLAGPTALSILDSMGLSAAVKVETNHFIAGNLRGLSLGLARTGENAFELWTTEADARVLWDRVMRAGKPLGLKPAGTAARTLMRLEAGAPRQGVDYFSALRAPAWAEAATPDGLGLSARVDLSGRGGFVGWQALAAATPPTRRLIRLSADTTEPVAHAIIAGADQRPLGYVTSSGYTPGTGSSLAFGWVELPAQIKGMALILPPNAASRGKLRRIECALLR